MSNIQTGLITGGLVGAAGCLAQGLTETSGAGMGISCAVGVAASGAALTYLSSARDSMIPVGEGAQSKEVSRGTMQIAGAFAGFTTVCLYALGRYLINQKS